MKQILLLAWLARRPDRTASRAQLAGFLWPNHTQENARGSLRQALTRLRAALGGTGDPFVVSSASAGLADARWSIDLVELEHAGALPPEAGCFLDGLHAREPEIQEWLESERRIVAAVLERTLRETLSQRIAAGAHQDAIGMALRLIALDPLDEDAHRRLMDLYRGTGQRARALEIFEDLKRRLEADLGEAPSRETRDLADRIRRADAWISTPQNLPSAPGTQAQSEALEASDPGHGSGRAPLSFPRPIGGALRTGLSHRQSALAGAILALLAVGGAGWLVQRPAFTPADPARMAYALPEKPSIAVLPFDNMSGDADQDDFVDAMTDSVITDLSRFRDLFVIARNSVFVYKGRAVMVQHVAEELGVQYVLEGGVQRSGERLRVNIQLIDALSGKHVWAERYDTDIEDLFAVQDRLAREIVSKLGGYQGEIAEAATSRAQRVGTRSLTAYETFLLAVRHKHRFTRDDTQIARDLLHRALAIDPQLDRAHTAIAWTHLQDYFFGWSEDREVALQRAHDAARQAVEVDPSDSEAHWVLGEYYATIGEASRMAMEYRRALELNPNNADILANWSWNLAFLPGRMGDALETMELAHRLNPNHPHWYKRLYGQMLFFARRFEDAIVVLETLDDGVWQGRAILAASRVHAGQTARARAEVEGILSLNPDASLQALQSAFARMRASDLDLLRAGIEAAGLPICNTAATSASLWPEALLPECADRNADE